MVNKREYWLIYETERKAFIENISGSVANSVDFPLKLVVSTPLLVVKYCF